MAGNLIKKNSSLIIIVILIVLTLIALILALINYTKITNFTGNIVQNPYCIRHYCSAKDAPVAYDLDDQEDLQRSTYSTLNYCLTNNPPEQFIKLLDNCAKATSETDPTLVLLEKNQSIIQDISKWIDYYASVFMAKCGYIWKLGDVGTVQAADNTFKSDEPKIDPNSKELAKSIHDDIAINGLACANVLKEYGIADITNTDGYDLLKLRIDEAEQGRTVP